MLRKYGSFIVFAGIGAWLAYGFGVKGLEAQQKRETWPKYSGVITDNRISSKGGSAGQSNYHLYIDFKINKRDSIRKFTDVFKGSGTKGSILSLSKGQYAVGEKIEVYINPLDPAEYLFELSHTWGPYLVGFLPGLLLFLMGFSTIHSDESEVSNES